MDLEKALTPVNDSFTKEDWVNSRVLGEGHCSGLIKVLPGNSDLYVSHVSWNT